MYRGLRGLEGRVRAQARGGEHEGILTGGVLTQAGQHLLPILSAHKPHLRLSLPPRFVARLPLVVNLYTAIHSWSAVLPSMPLWHHVATFTCHAKATT